MASLLVCLCSLRSYSSVNKLAIVSYTYRINKTKIFVVIVVMKKRKGNSSSSSSTSTGTSMGTVRDDRYARYSYTHICLNVLFMCLIMRSAIDNSAYEAAMGATTSTLTVREVNHRIFFCFSEIFLKYSLFCFS